MSDEVLSPDEQIIRDMGDEMNEIRVGRAKAYFQIRKLRTQLAEANERIEALDAGLTRIAAGKLWRYITDVYVCQWCGQPGEEGNIEHFACCPSVIAKKAREGSK